MALNLTPPDISELKPRITVFGVGGAGGNAVNNAGRRGGEADRHRQECGATEITRFKGLGEITAGEFKDFIGENIRLDPVDVDHLHSCESS